MRERLESLLSRLIQNVKEGKLDERITSYENYDSNYVFPKPRVIVKIELTSGKTAKIDITDYFEEETK